MYLCPKCAEDLFICGRQLICANGHSYDISAKGYVNLLLGNKRNGSHGDSREMLLSRRGFLSLGHYFPIVSELKEIIKENISPENNVIKILDAGCGEGYYTGGLGKLLAEKTISAEIYGIDVSKDAVAMASGAYKGINFSVSSINALPFHDKSFDFLLSLFAPLNEAEFCRVLKNGGILVTVSPSENHLYGLKEMIYEKPYKNPESTFSPKLFDEVGKRKTEYKIILSGNNEIRNLFKMTPYYFNTNKTDFEKLKNLSQLETEVGFYFHIFKKSVNR